jgi:hypothetical protein
MQATTKGKLRSIGSQFDFQLSSAAIHFVDALAGKFGHDEGVVGSRVRQTSDGNIAISYHFDFEDASALGNGIELVVNGFQQDEHLSRFSCGAP